MVKFKKKIKTKILEVLREILHSISRSRSPVFKPLRDLHVINAWFKFEGKIQNASKVIMFIRNHTDNDEIKNVCPQSGGGV